MKQTKLYRFQRELSSPSRKRRLTALALAAALGASVWGQNSNDDLTKASLEELANIQVTSVSKKEQSLSKAGAAVFVITQEDIRRSGMMNIPDLLRMVPGVDVARLDANTWAISIRGFNDRYSEQSPGAHRRPLGLQRNFLGRVLGSAECSAGRYRAHRGHPRTGRHGVGRQCRQRRDQHHHQKLQGYAGRSYYRPDRFGGKPGGLASIWREDWQRGTYRAFGNYFNVEPATAGPRVRRVRMDGMDPAGASAPTGIFRPTIR